MEISRDLQAPPVLEVASWIRVKRLASLKMLVAKTRPKMVMQITKKMKKAKVMKVTTTIQMVTVKSLKRSTKSSKKFLTISWMMLTLDLSTSRRSTRTRTNPKMMMVLSMRLIS